MKAKLTEEKITQNLKAAGCDCETIDCFLECCESGREQEGNKILYKHRKCLLDQVHEEQAKIDCLDYLVYKMREDKLKKK